MQSSRRRQLDIVLQLGRGGLWACTGLLGVACLYLSAWSPLGLGRYGVWYIGLYAVGTLLGLWLSRGRSPWRPALLLACQVVLLAGFIAWVSRGPDRSELEAGGDRILEALEAHRNHHGRYPDSLAEAGCVPQWNAFGGWQYKSPNAGVSYRLSVGEYDKDLFLLYRYADDTVWYWDT